MSICRTRPNMRDNEDSRRDDAWLHRRCGGEVSVEARSRRSSNREPSRSYARGGRDRRRGERRGVADQPARVRAGRGEHVVEQARGRTWRATARTPAGAPVECRPGRATRARRRCRASAPASRRFTPASTRRSRRSMRCSMPRRAPSSARADSRSPSAVRNASSRASEVGAQERECARRRPERRAGARSESRQRAGRRGPRPTSRSSSRHFANARLDDRRRPARQRRSGDGGAQRLGDRAHLREVRDLARSADVRGGRQDRALDHRAQQHRRTRARSPIDACASDVPTMPPRESAAVASCRSR